MTTPSRSRKERQEKSDESSASYDSGYASQPGGAKTDTIWFPTNPHNLSLEPYHDRVMLGAGEVIPLKPVRSFAIESTHQIVPHWPTIRAQLHGVFQELGFQWSSLRILHRRQTMAPREGLDDTTLVMAADKAYWGETPQIVLEDCFKIVKSITGSEIWIELINDRAKRSANEDDEDIEPERFSHNVKPLPGSSIGVRDLDWSSGTLGGYMELVDGKGGRIPCCLTNHHVLRPSRINPPPESEAKPKYDEELNIAGKLHEAVNQPKRPLTVDAPAMIDKARTLKYIRSYIERLEKKYGFYEAKATTGIERDVQRFAECKATLEGLKKEELRIENFDLSLGTLVASSGYRRSSRTRGALDWAIVTLNKDRVGQNSLESARNKTAESQSRVPSARSFVALPSTCEGINGLNFAILKDLKVLKIGKVTGATFGTVSHLKTDVRFADQPDVVNEEIVVVGDSNERFAEDGDSGGWVFDADGFLVGMMYAGGKYLNETYVTPIAEILTDIAESSGFEMVLP